MYKRYAALRDANGTNDSAVATATGIGRSTFTDWKSGRSEPKLSKLNKIANYFGVPLDYFVKEETKDSGFVIKGGIGNPVIGTINFPQNIHISAQHLLAWLMCEKEGLSRYAKERAANEDYAEAFSAKEISDAYVYIADCIKDAIDSGDPEWWFKYAYTDDC